MANHYVNTDQKSNDLMNFRCAKAIIDISVAMLANDPDNIIFKGKLNPWMVSAGLNSI